MKRSHRVNPHYQPGTWEDIKHYRELHTYRPIMTGHGVFDVNKESIERLEDAHENFDDLPAVINGKLKWKRADNTWVKLSRTQIGSLLKTLRKERSVRRSYLMEKAEDFKNKTVIPTPDELSDINYWMK